jgi:predicted RNase H-like HicB family nuclease
MKFQVTVDQDEEGVWITECPAIPGCISQGDTKSEALENIREAIRLCLEVRAELSPGGAAVNSQGRQLLEGGAAYPS